MPKKANKKHCLMEQPQTLFQTLAPWCPDIDIGTEEVIVHVAATKRQSLSETIDSWRKHGYEKLGFMFHAYGGTGADAFFKKHPEPIGQCKSGKPLKYVIPSDEWIAFVKDWIDKVVELGVLSIYPEEAETHAVDGYSHIFKREWERYYGTAWRDPASSMDARYEMSKLKSALWKRFFEEISTYIKENHPHVRCIIPIHSAINYATWHLVFAHSMLPDIKNCDGVIGQVWSDTAKSFIKYRGKYQRMVFENAYFEYSFFVNLMRGCSKPLWLFNDFLSDEANHGWSTYRNWYQDVLVASLLFPQTSRYEVTPWPEKFSKTEIYELGAFPPLGGFLGGEIPQSYVTELLSIWNAQAQFHLEDKNGVQGNAVSQAVVGVFISDTVMWQNHEPCPSNMDSFYGLCMPLLRAGVPVQILSLERLLVPGYLDAFTVLLLSYDAMKPLDERYHTSLSNWVEKGGKLIYFGGSDPYNRIKSWWKSKGLDNPQNDLFRKLGVNSTTEENEGIEWYTLLSNRRNTSNKSKAGEIHSIDIQSVLPADAVYVKVRQCSLENGGGSYFSHIALRNRDKAGDIKFSSTGGEEEQQYLVSDSGTGGADNNGRFVEGVGYVCYRFPTKGMRKAFLEIDIKGNFAIDLAKAPPKEVLLPKDDKFLKKMGPFIDTKGYAVTKYDVGSSSSCKIIYSAKETSKAVVWEKKCRKGKLLVVGIAANFFVTPEGVRLVRELFQHVSSDKKKQVGMDGHLSLKRGKFLIARSLTSPLFLKGDYVDIFDPFLSPAKDKTLLPGNNAFLVDITSLRGTKNPVVVASSSNLKEKKEEEKTSCFVSCGPETKIASIRIYSFFHLPVSVDAESVLTKEKLGVDARWDGNSKTLLLLHMHRVGGVRISVRWGTDRKSVRALPWEGRLEDELKNK